MSASILVALKDSMTSRAVVQYISDWPFEKKSIRMTLLHVFRKSSPNENLMGDDFVKAEEPKAEAFLKETREKFVEKGYPPGNIEIRLVTEPYHTVTDGIIDQTIKEDYDMVVIGRKRMSKAEEFVMGDISIKLVRVLKGMGVLVVESV